MNIAQCISLISSTWHGYQGVSTDVFNKLEPQIQLQLPSDYKEFMCWSNGGEGVFPAIRLSLWPAEDLVRLNSNYQINRYLGDHVLGIGSDGGPICFLLDYRLGNKPKFSSVNFGDLDPEEIKQIAPSFTSAIEYAITGKLIDEDL